jgi:hypothetical protein
MRCSAWRWRAAAPAAVRPLVVRRPGPVRTSKVNRQQTDRQAGRQADRQAGRQAGPDLEGQQAWDGQTDRQHLGSGFALPMRCAEAMPSAHCVPRPDLGALHACLPGQLLDAGLSACLPACTSSWTLVCLDRPQHGAVSTHRIHSYPLIWVPSVVCLSICLPAACSGGMHPSLSSHCIRCHPHIRTHAPIGVRVQPRPYPVNDPFPSGRRVHSHPLARVRGHAARAFPAIVSMPAQRLSPFPTKPT